MKKISMLLLSVLLVGCLVGCNSKKTGSDKNAEKKYETPVINVDYLKGQTTLDKTVERANELANGVQAYYDNSDRQNYIIENQNVQLTHTLSDKIFVSSLKNRQGQQYLFNSLDTYVVYNDETFYAKQSPTSARVNTTRLGYYYYSAYLRDLTFSNYIPLHLEKAYHTYSDKLHQAFRIIASESSEYITEFGFEVKVKRDTIDSVEILAEGKTYTKFESDMSLDKAEYIALDIKDAGVVGFIFAGEDTKLTVEANDRYVVIKQFVNLNGVVNEQEISLGNRLYTDETHDFTGIRKANSEEQNPLTSANITVDESVDNAKFIGYNHLTGAYDFELAGTAFTTAFYKEQQKKYYEHINVKGVTDDRTIYLRVHTNMPMEGAALVDSTNQLIPIPMQGCKNFGHEKEEPIYNPSDATYGETYMPLCVEAGKEYNFSILNVYQKWGNYDIKQLSSIDYFVSYYHLSTGVTETNCIAPYYSEYGGGSFDFAWFLPDFRGCSGNFWGNWDTQTADPQYNSVGTVYSPTNNKGSVMANYLASNIKYSGLTYADLDYSYISDDGNYKYTMRHVELPQNDESRTYYTIDFTFLKDCTLDNEQFSIIGFDGRNGIYSHSAYLDQNGQHQVVVNPNVAGQLQIYKLNKEGSYFAFYGLKDELETETGNFGLIVKDYNITVNGKESEVRLAFLNDFRTNYHWGDMNYGSLTLDKTTSFKKGDTIHIDMILLPCGLIGQDDCQNTINVYEDSVANPLKVEAQVGTVIEDTYIPTVAAKQGTAEFTLTGGTATNGKGVNYTVKVQGFDKLTIPKVYEKVNGEWIEYQFSTELGYDGYGVLVENDKLTYSFVFTQDVSGRTFKVVAE